jgi:hypothetical protein
MGAGASTKIEEFGPFGDINAVKSLCTELDKEFDEAKFNELKDEDGFVTNEQLVELLKAEPVEEVTGDSAEVAAAAEEGGPITIPLTALKETYTAAIAKGLTPLIVDPSKEHVVDTFFSYSAIMVDVKQLSLNVSMKKATKEESLEKARKSFVTAMQTGQTMVISMQQGSPSFQDWFNTPTEWPIEAIATKGGKPLTLKPEGNKEYGEGIPKAVMRDEDTLKYSGFAVVQEKFEVIFTTWFGVDDYEEFLFGDKMGLSKLSKDLFQVIIIKEE